MLTADLVNVRRRGKELRVVSLDAAKRARATELAVLFLDIAGGHVGRTREEVDEALRAVEVGPREWRLADGIAKLIEDRCQFDAEDAVDPEELRREVYLRASLARRESTFDRQKILETIAAERELPVDAVERGLYADLRAAHVLKSIEPIGAARLVDEYDLAQAQAVLLRAVRVVVDVKCKAPGAYRALFHKLKFLRLLHTISAQKEGGYRIEIDGPFSLFESVTKYGLQLAMALPVIRECDEWSLVADVRWGKQRMALNFQLEGKAAAENAPTPRLADEVARLLEDLRAIESDWRAKPSSEILNLPGAGLCVPDLLFEHRKTGECVYLEVLGFWSRAAVWRRVELIERGLPQRILFAVSQKLRVSEEALGDEQPGALYVYKRLMSARTILERVDALSQRAVR